MGRNNIGGTVFLIVAGLALTVAGFLFIPPLIQKYSNKVYKAYLRRETIDFDNMGPEIVPKKKRRKTNERN